MMNMPYVDKKVEFINMVNIFQVNFLCGHIMKHGHKKYFPLTKEEALEKGFKWYDEKIGDYKITIKAKIFQIILIMFLILF